MLRPVKRYGLPFSDELRACARHEDRTARAKAVADLAAAAGSGRGRAAAAGGGVALLPSLPVAAALSLDPRHSMPSYRRPRARPRPSSSLSRSRGFVPWCSSLPLSTRSWSASSRASGMQSWSLSGLLGFVRERYSPRFDSGSRSRSRRASLAFTRRPLARSQRSGIRSRSVSRTRAGAATGAITSAIPARAAMRPPAPSRTSRKHPCLLPWFP